MDIVSLSTTKYIALNRTTNTLRVRMRHVGGVVPTGGQDLSLFRRWFPTLCKSSPTRDSFLSVPAPQKARETEGICRSRDHSPGYILQSVGSIRYIVVLSTLFCTMYVCLGIGCRPELLIVAGCKLARSGRKGLLGVSSLELLQELVLAWL